MDYLNSKISEARMLRCEEAGYIRGVREGTAKGREEGREEGRTEERLALAKSLLMEGVSPEIISKSTGLTIEELKAL